MEDILERVKQLKDAELREQLKGNGLKVGPITPSTRLLFQKRLAKILFALEYPDQKDGDDSDSSSKEKPQEKKKDLQPVTPVVANSDAVTSMYFAVCLPSEEETYGGDLVFTDRLAALSLMKKYKDSRFKVFKNRQDAEDFTKPSVIQPKSPSQSQSSESGIEKTSTGIAVEKSAYRGPKPGELVTLRRAIERGDTELFKTTVWENPRYMISSADTPVILHEGLRYNALHVAAISNKPAMCKLILNTISNPEFTQKLYCFSQESEETKQRRIDFIFDLYLNMPDKGNGESPLHFACKFGFPDVVRVLLEYPGVDRSMLNRYDETPAKVCCSRSKNPTPELRARLEELLQGLCYVPLLRSEDNTTAPMIGQPWSPDNILEPHDLLHKNPTDPQLTVRAYAGPMSPSRARVFHRQWTTPPSPSPRKQPTQSNPRREDGDKGLERIGRQLAHDMHVAWLEYWEFLDAFVDFSTEKGIRILEEYLLKQQSLVVYKQWVKTHSTQINNVCLDSSIVSECSQLTSFTENDSINSLDSEVSPIRNDLFRHNKIDRGIVKDFDNSDNEISEIFAKGERERASDSSDTSEKYRNEKMDISENRDIHTNKIVQSDLRSQYVLQPAKLKCGIDAPDTAFKLNLEKSKTSENVKTVSNNLTDEIKLVTPSREPCEYDFKCTLKTDKQTSSPNHVLEKSANENVSSNQSETEEVKSTPSWRDGRIKSEDSEETNQDNYESPLKELDQSTGIHTPTKGNENLDDSVLKGFSKLQLGSSDEDSFKSAVSDMFSTPSNRPNLDMSFNSQLSNLCDDLKQKLIFTPRNRLSRTVSVVSSLSDMQEAIILKTKHSNFNFEQLKILSNFNPSVSNPVPVLLIVKNSGENPDISECDILADCILYDLDQESECLCIFQVQNNVVITVPTLEQKHKLLSYKTSALILSLCLYKDDIPTCIELSVPSLFTKIDPKDPYYILGQRASKLDQDVYRALVADDTDMNCFPLTEKWRKNITSLQAESQQSWPSPSRIKRESRLSGDFSIMSPLVGHSFSTPSVSRYLSPFQGSRTSLSPSVFQFTPKTSRLTSSPHPPQFNLEKHLEESNIED